MAFLFSLHSMWFFLVSIDANTINMLCTSFARSAAVRIGIHSASKQCFDRKYVVSPAFDLL